MSRHATTIGRTTDVARDGRAAVPASSRATSDAISSRAAPAPLVPDFFTRLASPVPQTKLTVSQPGDRLEREADAAADRVMGGSLRMSSPGAPDDAGTEAAADAVAHAPTGATTTAAEGDLQRHASQADGALRRHESQADDVPQRHASRADSAAERPASQANAALQPHASPAGRTTSDATVSNAPSVESRLASLRGSGAPRCRTGSATSTSSVSDATFRACVFTPTAAPPMQRDHCAPEHSRMAATSSSAPASSRRAPTRAAT